MHPKGHLASSVALSAGTFVATGSPAMAAGAFVGGFLIDLDHFFDYVAFNGQRSLSPRRFLNYYMNLHVERIVLALHSYELTIPLTVLAFAFPNPWLVGYAIGAAMHLSLDLIFNQGAVGSTLRFYSILYRAQHGFSGERLLRGEDVAARQQRSLEAALREQRSAEAA